MEFSCVAAAGGSAELCPVPCLPFAGSLPAVMLQLSHVASWRHTVLSSQVHRFLFS